MKINHSYFVVMVNYGKRGLEAIVHPEDTRRAVVKMIADGDLGHIVFIHHVDNLLVEDVTLDIMDEVEVLTELRRAEDAA